MIPLKGAAVSARIQQEIQKELQELQARGRSGFQSLPLYGWESIQIIVLMKEGP